MSRGLFDSIRIIISKESISFLLLLVRHLLLVAMHLLLVANLFRVSWIWADTVQKCRHALHIEAIRVQF